MSPRALWNRWVAFCGRSMDSRPLVLVLYTTTLCVLLDLVDMAVRGALPLMVYGVPIGGMVQRPTPWLLLPDGAALGPGLWLTMVAACVFILAGVGRRPAILVLLLAYSQFGHFFPGGDRAIDRTLRSAMLLFLFSGVAADKPDQRVSAWPADLIRLYLVLMYVSAGVVKLKATHGWWDPTMQPELFSILADPLAGKLDPDTWRFAWPAFYLGSVATILTELGAPLILTRFSRYWAVFGAMIHLGIAAMMYLGMFSWGMLAFYPLLFSPWTEQLADRLGWREPESSEEL